MKKLVIIAFACVLSLGMLVGCSSSNDEPDYADDEAMNIIADGWMKRSDALEGVDSTDDEYASKLKEGIQVEIDNDSSLKDRQFENTQLQEDVLAYLNSLEAQIDVLESYSMADLEFYEAWQKAYDERSVLLKKFVDEYGFTVDDKYQDILDDLLANGTATEKENSQKEAIDSLLANAKWDKEDDGYGYYTYTAVIENTTDYDYKDVSVILELYDSDDVKTETYASASNWEKGDKVKFEAFGEVDTARIDATVEYYDVAE
jgi:hypothetical protein